MDEQLHFPKFKIAIIALVILSAGIGCNFFSGSSTSTVPKDQNSSPPSDKAATSDNQNSPTTLPSEPTATAVTIPDGWKVSNEPTGACPVATPPDWQLGVDFFIGMGKADPVQLKMPQVNIHQQDWLYGGWMTAPNYRRVTTSRYAPRGWTTGKCALYGASRRMLTLPTKRKNF